MEKLSLRSILLAAIEYNFTHSEVVEYIAHIQKWSFMNKWRAERMIESQGIHFP